MPTCRIVTGAAIAVALAASKASAVPRHVVGINGAFLPIRGNALFSPLAKALFANPKEERTKQFLSKFLAH